MVYLRLRVSCVNGVMRLEGQPRVLNTPTALLALRMLAKQLYYPSHMFVINNELLNKQRSDVVCTQNWQFERV